MTEFLQIIEYKTKHPDQIRELSEKFNANRGVDSGPQPRIVVAADRDEKDMYRTIVEFPDYQTAMENSNRSDTTEFAMEMAKLCEGQPKFYNMDILNRM